MSVNGLRRMLLTNIIMLFSVSLAAAPQLSTDAADALAASLASVNTLSGKFEQTITDAEGETLQHTFGEFKIKRPGLFFWHVAPPYEQVVVGTPTSLKVYDPDLEQMTVHGEEALTGTPAALISGDGTKIAEHYAVTKTATKKQTVYNLSQKPGGNGAFASLQLVFETKNKKQRLVKMVFVDKLDQSTEVTLSDTKVNPDISDNEFRFDPPKDTDIIIDG